MWVMKSINPAAGDVSRFAKEVLAACQEEIKHQKKFYEKTTATWRHKPKFVGEVKFGRDVMVRVTTTDQVWNWLNRGTRKNYPITPKRAPLLKFRTGYKAKTRPRRFSSTTGGAKGPWRSAKKVIHPGIEARDWTGAMLKARQNPFRTRIELAIQKAAQRMYREQVGRG